MYFIIILIHHWVFENAEVIAIGLIFLRLPLVEERTGLKRSSILALVAAGLFPKPVRLQLPQPAKRERKTAARRPVNVWSDEEIARWQEAQLARRDAGLDKPASCPPPPPQIQV
jgi:predicted DNA-binding transcriptional regulator AlpA